jgi:hypothetical protein
MAQPGVTLIKSFLYRGATEEWSNQYHLNAHPSDAAGWRTLVDALVALERHVYSNHVSIIRALCYENTDDASVYTYTLADFAGNVLGDLSAGALYPVSGDDACWVRWDSGHISSTGKKVYLRKYFHDVFYDDAAHRDYVATAQRTALETFGTAMLATFSSTYRMTDPNGDTPPGPRTSSPYITTRTLKRRGRRP